MSDKVFTPHELKTIEVDTEKKIFRVNGEDFGKGCNSFVISCDFTGFKVTMNIETRLSFASYERNGVKSQEINVWNSAVWIDV